MDEIIIESEENSNIVYSGVEIVCRLGETQRIK